VSGIAPDPERKNRHNLSVWIAAIAQSVSVLLAVLRYLKDGGC
jgi:hypothetical protein